MGLTTAEKDVEAFPEALGKAAKADAGTVSSAGKVFDPAACFHRLQPLTSRERRLALSKGGWSQRRSNPAWLPRRNSAVRARYDCCPLQWT